MGTFNHKLARRKATYSESEAFQAILQSNPQITVDQLQPEHTPSMWHWQLTVQQSDGTKNLFTVEKQEDKTLTDAIYEAMAYFETFEGNIKLEDEDETHWVLAKVRG